MYIHSRWLNTSASHTIFPGVRNSDCEQTHSEIMPPTFTHDVGHVSKDAFQSVKTGGISLHRLCETNQPNSQTDRQTESQPTNHPSKQATSRPARRSASQPGNQLTNQPTNLYSHMPFERCLRVIVIFLPCSSGFRASVSRQQISRSWTFLRMPVECILEHINKLPMNNVLSSQLYL